MRSVLASVLFLGTVLTVQADTFVYVSMGPDQKIAVYRLNQKDGKLTAVDTVATDGAPGALATDPRNNFLFASLRTDSKLASYRIDPATGKLKLVSTAALPKGENAVFVGTDTTGKWLMSASYAAGKIVVHEVKEDGTIKTPPVQTIETVKTAHAAVADPINRFIFVPHVAANAIYQYRIDAASGKLTEAGKAPGGMEKSGPRHLAFNPQRKFGYTSDETGNSITAYRYEDETGLKPIQTLSTLPEDFKGMNTTAEVKVHPSGKYVWVSNRGHDSLAGFAIGEGSKLTPLERTPTEKTPRSFDIDPSGRYLLVAGEGNGKLTVYQIDEATGKLTRVQTYEVGKSLTWVRIVGIPER
jgi:6-phosphogluconolactonase